MATTYSAHSNVEFFFFYCGEILQLQNEKKTQKNVVSRDFFTIFRNKIIKLTTSTPRDFLELPLVAALLKKTTAHIRHSSVMIIYSGVN
jgi:hypothetical protein